MDRQAPLSMGFSRPEYGVGCHFLHQGIFLNQELNLHLLDWQADSLPLSHQGSLNKLVLHFVKKSYFLLEQGLYFLTQ